MQQEGVHGGTCVTRLLCQKDITLPRAPYSSDFCQGFARLGSQNPDKGQQENEENTDIEKLGSSGL